MAERDQTTWRGGDGARALLQVLPMPAAIVDAGGTVVARNEDWAVDGLEGPQLDRVTSAVLRHGHERFEIELAPVGDEERWRQARTTALGTGALVILQDVTARRLLEATVQSMEGREAQTGLLDGAGILEVLAHRLLGARQRGTRLALAQVVVLGLEEVRAALGEPAAAEVMARQVARVRRATRDDDTVCRIAEDQFLLIFDGLGEVGLEHLCERLLDVLRAPCSIGGRAIRVDAIVGRVLVVHGASAQDALDAVDEDVRARRRRADARSAAGSCAPGGPPPLPRDLAPGERRTASQSVSATVPRAEGPGQFRPLFDARSGSLVGAELVDRSRSADGMREALRSAGRLATAWERAAPAVVPSVVVALPHGWEREADQTLELVREQVAAGVVDAGALVVQVSGQDLAAEPGATTASLGRLRALGVRVLLDDAGRLDLPVVQLVGSPLDLIRVDVGGKADGLDLSVRTSVLAAVVGASKALGLRVIAAGVEVARDRLGLAELGVGLVQGPEDQHRSAAELLADLEEGRRTGEGGAPSEVGAGLPSSTASPAEDLDASFRAMAHEIRTPLTVAMGYASLLETSSDPAAASAAANIRRATERINRMLRHVEDVRMIDQGNLDLEVRDLDLRALVEEVVADQRDLVGVPVELDPGGLAGPVLVTVDEIRIGQVLSNLISNAAKFSAPGAPIEVRLAAARAGRSAWVEVAVADRGPGIPAAQLATAFAKYGRADRTRPGSGLGLYLAQGVARAHGGDISYRHRRDGPGSVFALVLPAAASSVLADSSDPGRPASSDEALRRPSSGR